MISKQQSDPSWIAVMLRSVLMKNCPKDMYNLVNTIEFIPDSNGNYCIGIGGTNLATRANTKAPYAKATNEDNKKHYRKGGPVKPGQSLYHWIEKSIDEVVSLVEGGPKNV